MLYSGQAFGTKSCIVINAGGAVFSNTGKGDRMSWTEERIERLRQLWGSGRSASEIAEILGDVSRNAIIGKAHRLGLSGRPSPIKAKREEPVARKRPVIEQPAGATIPSLTRSEEHTSE